MFLKFKIFIYNLLFIQPKIWWKLNFDPLIRAQRKNPQLIPIIIINFNQLFYLKKLVNFLVKRKFENIIIIDNLSTYPPLLEYYKTLKGVKVEYMDDNYGHKIFFENKELQEKYAKGFYVVTDADIVPNEDLPVDFMNTLLKILVKEFYKVTKAGFALKTDDIPLTYTFRDQVLDWESKFWVSKYHHSLECYYAKLDTTFALYKPKYPRWLNGIDFLRGIRIAGDFTATHGGWYIDPNNLTEEQKFYQQTSSSASSWLIKEDGKLDSTHSQKYSKIN